MGKWWKWYIHIHEMVDFYGFHVGKYTSPMDPMGNSMHGIITYNVVGQYSIHGGLEGTKTKNISVNNLPWHIMKSRSYDQNPFGSPRNKNFRIPPWTPKICTWWQSCRKSRASSPQKKRMSLFVKSPNPTKSTSRFIFANKKTAFTG